MSAKVMGILNVTPDSFSDGGAWLEPSVAVAHGLTLANEGAAFIDVGGESTRPGAKPVSVDEECSRVVPVIEALSSQLNEAGHEARISIDTRNGETARAAVGVGASLINDISANLSGIAGDLGVGWVAMHMSGTPETMQHNPQYDDVVREVHEFLGNAVEAGRSAGVDEIYLDPGIGFGKTVEHNCQLLNSLSEFCELGFPVVVGASRKGFIDKIQKQSAVERTTARLGGSIAAALFAANNGAQVVRVHDVAQSVQALAVADAIKAAGGNSAREGNLKVMEQ